MLKAHACFRCSIWSSQSQDMHLGRGFWWPVHSSQAGELDVATIKTPTGGCTAAALLASRTHGLGLKPTARILLQITLIDQNEQFVFKPLLYELINGGATPGEVAPLFKDLLAPMNSTNFVQVQ